VFVPESCKAWNEFEKVKRGRLELQGAYEICISLQEILFDVRLVWRCRCGRLSEVSAAVGARRLRAGLVRGFMRVVLVVIVIAVDLGAIKERLFLERYDLVVEALTMQKRGQKLAPWTERLGMDKRTQTFVGSAEGLDVAK